jgi:hypothetical protein
VSGGKRRTLCVLCPSCAGRVGFYPVSTLAGHVIKTERDPQIAEALLPLVELDGGA